MSLTPFQIHLEPEKVPMGRPGPGVDGKGSGLYSSSDLDAYPVLTEEVGFAPSPLAKSGPGLSAGQVGAGASGIGQTAFKAIADVLGWKPRSGDAKGFVGALTQSFTLTETRGRMDASWTPRTYAVQTDLCGGITGAQASMYARAKQALDQSLPLLDGLYTLNPDASPEDIAAVKNVSKSQLSEMVNELGLAGGPRVWRVNQYFNLLLGSNVFPVPPPVNHILAVSDPDQVQGTLGQLRELLGLSFTTQDFMNSVEDEQDASNFRLISDYVTSLAQSWLNNVSFFGLNPSMPFFGTQLVWISRQLNVVAESVDEVRFTLDSVFLGPAERQTLPLHFPGQGGMYLEEFFDWIQSFASEEGPRLIQDGGKFGVVNTFVPILHRLTSMVHHITEHGSNVTVGLPHAFFTARVQRALKQLQEELKVLVNMSRNLRHEPLEPDTGTALAPLQITDVLPDSGIMGQYIGILGQGFEVSATGNPPTVSVGGKATPAFFRSDQSLTAVVPSGLAVGTTYDVTVQNPDPNSAPASLRRAFKVEG